MKTKLAILVLAIGFVGGSVNTGTAQDWPFGCYGGWGWGLLYQNLDHKIPYFAAYPPVYYSYPVPRTYGYSPFAYPPGVMTPEIIEAPATPVTIINPYVEQRDEKEPAAEDKLTRTSRTIEPLVILNPYVQPRASLAQAAN